MKSKNVASGETGYSEQYDSIIADAFGASQLLPHQQLGILALPTNPSNTQTWTVTINGSAVSGTFVTSIGAAAGNVLIGADAATTAANLLKLLQSPQTTTSTGIALSAANQALLVFCGYALNGTSITIYSQNNSTYAPLTSFTASTTATSGSWTANTMALYIEPGTYYVGITKVVYAGGNTSTFTAPSTHPRIDIVTLDSSGTLAVTTGSESASPTAPSYPANKLVICEVFHRVSETVIRDWDDGTQGYVSNDVRPLLAPPYISDSSQVATQIFIPWISSPAQGDVIYYDGSSWTRLAAGTSGFYLQTQGGGANPQWSAFNVPETSGTNSAPALSGTGTQTVTHTVTHGLGKRPQFITATINDLTCPVPSGSGTTHNDGYAWIFLDTNGNAQGGISIQVNTSTFAITSLGVAPTSVSASGSTSGGTGSASITIQNVTTTTFDIVYSATISSGSMTFTPSNVPWMVFG